MCFLGKKIDGVALDRVVVAVVDHFVAVKGVSVAVGERDPVIKAVLRLERHAEVVFSDKGCVVSCCL